MGIKNSRPERTPLQSDTAINRSTETSTRHTHELPPPYDPPPPFPGPVIPTEGSLPGRSAWVSPHTRGFYNAFQESSNVPTGVPPPEYSPVNFDKRNQ
uniref:Uncharacterized protein n=1 Tax=Panagrolaimus davidi TaxID=227884 RepID=A0A914PAU6_9BILA